MPAGAHEIHGAIVQAWANDGYEKGHTPNWVSDSTLGYPVTDETPLTNFRNEPGRFSGFEGGSIDWSPRTGAHVMAGAFLNLYAGAGFEKACAASPAAIRAITSPCSAAATTASDSRTAT